MRVELNDGAWVDITDPADLRDKDRKMVNKAITLSLSDTGQPVLPGDMDDKMQDALLKRIVTQWSFENLPLPKDDPESLDKLTIPDARMLHDAIKDHMQLITGSKSYEAGRRPGPELRQTARYLAGASYDSSLIPWDELRYAVYAERFGWSPDQVDQLTLSQDKWIIPLVDSIVNEQVRKREEAQKNAK